jgi:hypothetical protein
MVGNCLDRRRCIGWLDYVVYFPAHFLKVNSVRLQKKMDNSQTDLLDASAFAPAQTRCAWRRWVWPVCTTVSLALGAAALIFALVPVPVPAYENWVLARSGAHAGPCTLEDASVSIAYAQVFAYDMTPTECWLQYCPYLNCEVAESVFRGCFIRSGRTVAVVSLDRACINATYESTPPLDASANMTPVVESYDEERDNVMLDPSDPEYEDYTDVLRHSQMRAYHKHVRKLGGTDMRVIQQHAKGMVTLVQNGARGMYTASSRAGDGNAGKNPRAMRTEDSWQDAREIHRLFFTATCDKNTSTGTQIVHHMQLKRNKNDKYPVIGIGQKKGYWAVKIGSRKSVSLGMPCTTSVNVQIVRNHNANHDVLVNGRVYVSVKLTSSSILKTGVYTSDWQASVKPGVDIALRLTDISLKRV